MLTPAAWLLAALLAEAPFEPVDGGLLRLDPSFLASAAGAERLEALPVEVPGLGALVLQLERLPDARIGELWVDGQPLGLFSEHLDPLDSLWRGRVAGAADSHVFLSLSAQGSRGWISVGERRLHLLAAGAGPAGGLSRWSDEAELRALGASAPGNCKLRLPPGARPLAPASAPPPGGSGQPGAAGAPPPAGPLPLYQCRVVLETDFSFFGLFGSIPAASSYVNALVGAISATYEAEVGCRLLVPQIGIYTSEAADPFDTNSAGGLLEEMRQRWIGGLNQLGDLGHVLSAAPDGGVAYLNVLCNSDFGVGANCSMGGNTPLPIVQGPLNWDFFVLAHELGHNFATPHTHDYCPPIDQCAPNGFFGGCQTSSVCSPGTIMSYCHLCGSGIANIAPNFGAQVAQTMRSAVVSSCLPQVVVPPVPPQISAASPTLLPALVVDGNTIVTLTGKGFSQVTGVSVDGQALLDLPPQYSIVSDTQLTLQFPIVSKVGPVTIQVVSPLGSANTSVTVVYNTAPTLELLFSNPTFILQFLGFDIYVAGGFGDTAFLVGSTSLLPSSLPGIAEFGLGAGLTQLYFFGSKQISAFSGWARFQLPLSGNLPTGLQVHFQAGLLRFLNPTLPLSMTNVQSGTILF
jgi:hypothetical protein